jgi:phospholipase C
MPTDRRSFLKLMSTGALAASFPESIARALAIPAATRTRSIADVEHIVVLMQENRSFDHYFGTLRGVRGFGDPRAVKLANGDPVWYQPDGWGGYVLPFHLDVAAAGLTFVEDLAHDWVTTHNAVNQGSNDQWVPQKGTTTMVHLSRNDIPFHYALADAFTVCDGYHCSLLGPTDPNRYHMWTGWVGNDGSGGGPVVDNAEAGYGWKTYPERLTAAGISWKVYQDVGAGLSAAKSWGWGENAYIGNYGDSSLLYFHQYQNSQPGSPLYEAALTGTDISASGNLVDQFRADVLGGKLPQVSYIVAPEAYCEHPNWPVNYGAWYIAQFLDALTANPDVWSKTALFITWDENDGFFDHVVPPMPPETRMQGLSTVPILNEIFPGDATYPAGPYGLGVRVPMLVLSPWSKGGYVSSEVFDHTSIIRFMEARYADRNPALIETNITPWRRAVAGDLTSAFDFQNPNDKVVTLPSTTAYFPPDQVRHPDFVPTVPAKQTLPVQEPGTRPARPVPYALEVHGMADPGDGSFKIVFANRGKTAVLQVRSGNSALGPWVYTVGRDEKILETWAIAANNLTGYDLNVYGPNGFLRAFKGSITGGNTADVEVRAEYGNGGEQITLHCTNKGAHAVDVQLRDNYSGKMFTHAIEAGDETQQTLGLGETSGWYDVTVGVEQDASFRWQVAGHMETGRESITDPAIGAAAAAALV